MNTHPQSHRLALIWHSFRSVPLWVQVWVAGILVPANAAAFLLLDTWSGQMAAWAASFVVLTNVPIMWKTRGMSRLMSVPHLIAWLPLEVALLARLAGHAGHGPLTAWESVFVTLLLVVNGVSLIFDALDSWRWLRGERDVPGHTL